MDRIIKEDIKNPKKKGGVFFLTLPPNPPAPKNSNSFYYKTNINDCQTIDIFLLMFLIFIFDPNEFSIKIIKRRNF